MFTGIIESKAEVVKITRGDIDITIGIKLAVDLEDRLLGESIALDGVCLTLVRFDSSIYYFDISKETLSRSTFKDITLGRFLNLERALMTGSRFGGHIVSGHVDSVERIEKFEKSGRGYILGISVSSDYRNYTIEKGSIAIDGISLTISKKLKTGIEIALIPHSYQKTTLSSKKVGDFVNIEYDQVGKYIENFIKTDKSRSLTYDKLRLYGYEI